MPCNGIAVTQANVAIDWEEYFAHEEHRVAFAEALKQIGLPVKQWWRKCNDEGELKAYALGIGTDWTGLAFVGNRIEVSDEGDYAKHKDAVDKAYGAALEFVQVATASQVLDMLGGAGMGPTLVGNVNGVIQYRFYLPVGGKPVSAVIGFGRAGNVELMTEGGTFDGGAAALGALLEALGANDLSVTPSGRYEQHRHHMDNVQAWERQQV